MDRKQLDALMPRDKTDTARAETLAALDYATVAPGVPAMLRWLRTFRVPGDRGSEESRVAEIFIGFFIRHADAAGDAVEEVLRTSRQDHLKYVIVTRVLPEWPRSAIERVRQPLALLVTDTGQPETALMALQLLLQHGLGDGAWLNAWLVFSIERLDRNLREAHRIADTYFEPAIL
jgi:hypothetical protein